VPSHGYEVEQAVFLRAFWHWISKRPPTYHHFSLFCISSLAF